MSTSNNTNEVQEKIGKLLKTTHTTLEKGSLVSWDVLVIDDIAKFYDAIESLIQQEVREARIDELQWGKMQFSGLDKSRVGRSFYTRNTAFKNYAVKFWNNRAKVKRDKFNDRISALSNNLSKEDV